ncbi:MAG: hypothetical protein M1829_006357 [Trizodia sp. TS-e1964]|nr:MAG: hypothetical protein M1829_006357 [Trizodia sp. TS-e1964]
MPSSRLVTKPLLVIFLCSFLFLTFIRFQDSGPRNGPTSSSPVPMENIISFWNDFSRLLVATKPHCPKPKRLGSAAALGFDSVKPDTPRPDLLQMPEQDITEMISMHEKFLQGLKKLSSAPIYTPNTRGIVTTAGGPYIPILVVSLRMLRLTGSTLPVEVFLANRTEYEPESCEVIMPALNAKCVILSEILEAVPEPVMIESYQFKIFAMIFSSFQNILFLDADNLAVASPDELFYTEPFLSHGMVTWPDFWASSVSPLFYKITAQPTPLLKASASTESGQVLVSKKSHFKVLLLAAYYNFHGPSHYYSLLSQGAAGEGDKETFIAAATKLDATYYNVKQPVKALGFPLEGSWRGVAMEQYNAAQDYQIYQAKQKSRPSTPLNIPQRLFIHANFPKMDPATVLLKNITRYANGEFHRIWDISQDPVTSIELDLEITLWKQIMWVACEHASAFLSWRGITPMCEPIKDHMRHTFPELGPI